VWQNSTVPPVDAGAASTDTISITRGSVVEVNSTMNYNPRLHIGNSAGAGTVRVMAGGDLTVNQRVYVGINSGTNMGLLSIEGGTLHAKGATGNYGFYVASGVANYGATGYLAVSSGSLLFDQGNMQFGVGINGNGANSGANATINQTGGTIAGAAYLTVSGTTTLTDGYSLSSQISLMGGVFSLSGQTNNAHTFGTNAVSGVHVALTVSSNMTTFSLGNNTQFSGSDTKLIFDVAQRGSWGGKTIAQFGGALAFDGAAGVIVDFSNFGLWDGAVVNETITITLATYGSLSDTSTATDQITGLDEEHFSASTITWGTNAATIDITYIKAIPEPAACAGLLGVLALAFVTRRRR